MLNSLCSTGIKYGFMRFVNQCILSLFTFSVGFQHFLRWLYSGYEQLADFEEIFSKCDKKCLCWKSFNPLSHIVYITDKSVSDVSTNITVDRKNP